MAGWSDLSTALKRNVIGRLDLMSRHSFRVTDRENRTIVDTTDHFIPRARFSLNDAKFLIVIHSGIDDWLRVEIADVDGKTVVKKSQNSWKPEDAVETVSQYRADLCAFYIILSLLSRKAILIDAMEFEVVGGADAEEEDEEESINYCTMMMVNLVSALRQLMQCNHVFRVRKLVTGWNSYPDLEYVISEMLVPDELKCYERLSLSVNPDCLTPIICNDSTLPIDHFGKPQSTSTILHTESIPGFCSMRDALMVLASVIRGFATLRFPKIIDCVVEMWNSVNGSGERVSENLLRKEEIIPFPKGKLYFVHFKSICGYWSHAVYIRNRSELDAHLKLFYAEHKKTGVCGLGWLCKRCTNAFDYHYYQNIGRRVYLEPEWSNIQVRGFEASGSQDIVDGMVEAARRMYAKDAEKAPKNPKTSEKKSWGFRARQESEDSEDIIVESFEGLKV